MAERTSIDPRTRLGAVELTAARLDRLVPFYQNALGLRLQGRDVGQAEMSAGGETLLRLVERPDARRSRGTTGLYHFAVLLPSRRELARAIARLIALEIPNYPTDHVMTSTTYLSDPEGNGIELYADTPEDGAWSFEDGRFVTRDALGALRSGRDPLDLDVLFRELSPADKLDQPMPPETRIGHIHLHVREVDEAVRFYRDLIGFDLMGASPEMGAAFLSAGGYHHHVGVNIWMGEGAPPPAPGSLGLRHFTIVVPEGAEVERVAGSLRSAGVPFEASDGGLLVRDPSENGVLLRTVPPSA
jgi:catechol 2,3-dioxygenase